jgi:hypothetical protein
MPSITRRRLLNWCTGGATAVLVSQISDLLPIPSGKGRIIEAVIQGKRVWLEEVPKPSRNAVYAQAYYPYTYQNPYSHFCTCSMMPQYNYGQYAQYMQGLAQQYAWTQNYVAQMASYMQQYSRGYSLSQPFAMNEIRSLYSFGDADSSDDDLLFGLNAAGNHVVSRGKSVKLVDAIADISDDENWNRRKKERSSGPQSNSRPMTAALKGGSVGGTGFDSANGSTFISSREYRNTDSGETGSIVMFDTGAGKEARLVPV